MNDIIKKIWTVPSYCDYGTRPYWLFDCSMVGTFSPYFDDCESNYEVEDKLRKAKVIRHNNRTDTEFCSLVVMFSSEKSKDAFCARLTDYIQKKDQLLAEARAF